MSLAWRARVEKGAEQLGQRQRCPPGQGTGIISKLSGQRGSLAAPPGRSQSSLDTGGCDPPPPTTPAPPQAQHSQQSHRRQRMSRALVRETGQDVLPRLHSGEKNDTGKIITVSGSQGPATVHRLSQESSS